MKRICIYLTYDKQNIIDRYIGYMLKQLKTCTDHLVVVCNETEIIRGVEILEAYANEIFYRENVGLDVGGFKDVLCNFMGWDRILQYDELVLVNDSMFGPFKPMKSIFSEMEKNPVDFWGLSMHGDCPESRFGQITKHIQSFFVVVRFSMLHGQEFKRYWEELPYFSTYKDAVKEHEIRFTQYFSELGYTFGCLANTEVNDSIDGLNNYSQYALIPYEMIKKRNFPFLKKQPLICELLNCQTQEGFHQSLDFIDKKTDYDIRLIWENIIRTLNMTPLQKNLHLQYIVSSVPTKHYFCGNIAILICVTYKNSFEYIQEYIQGFDLKDAITIFAEKKENLIDYQKEGLKCRNIQFSQFYKILSEYSTNDFVVVLHDTDMTSDKNPSYVGKSYFFHIWENLMKNSGQVFEIIEQFLKEPYLGFLAAPQPNFGQYFGEYKAGWNGYFHEVVRMAKKLNLNCQISEYYAPFRITNDFWIRGQILKKLAYMESEDAQYLPYLWIYLAQDAGFYSGIVESIDYASMNEVNMQYYLQQITSQVQMQYGEWNSFFEMKKILSLFSMQEYCKRYSKVYIYGTGDIANQYRKFVPNIEAYLVTDGQEKLKELDGIEVIYLSESEVNTDCGLVLCLDRKNQLEVIPLLKEQGINHYFCV